MIRVAIISADERYKMRGLRGLLYGTLVYTADYYCSFNIGHTIHFFFLSRAMQNYFRMSRCGHRQNKLYIPAPPHRPGIWGNTHRKPDNYIQGNARELQSTHCCCISCKRICSTQCRNRKGPPLPPICGCTSRKKSHLLLYIPPIWQGFRHGLSFFVSDPFRA